jgi:hypothetical protein
MSAASQWAGAYAASVCAAVEALLAQLDDLFSCCSLQRGASLGLTAAVAVLLWSAKLLRVHMMSMSVVDSSTVTERYETSPYGI